MSYTFDEQNLISTFNLFSDFSYKEIAIVLNWTISEVMIVRNAANKKGANLLARHIKP